MHKFLCNFIPGLFDSMLAGRCSPRDRWHVLIAGGFIVYDWQQKNGTKLGVRLIQRIVSSIHLVCILYSWKFIGLVREYFNKLKAGKTSRYIPLHLAS